MNRAGYVLVGGRSSRMGRDKAFLPFRGQPLAAFVASTVSEAAGIATLIGEPELYAGFSYAVIPDLYPGEGPLGGILTALRHTTAAWNLVTACDMPGLSPQFLGRLLDQAAEADADVLLPIGPSGLPEPLCAVYHRRCAAPLQARFAGGVRKISDAVAGLQVSTRVVSELAPFQNVNTPEDWSIYAE